MTTVRFSSTQPAPSPREASERLGEAHVRTAHPQARLIRGAETSSRAEYFYVLPDGRPVARFTFAFITAGWHLESATSC
ncbi:hypothetical protein [Kineosporia succinea]|uniref:GNAT family N-acetyltransferase n=1 Tax=Kineosporia succinea TaxID=84632 RepID=A0ABT9PE11_9ACTN|nr:hypothetical protein [Kineosporia succinea]MDP9830943.1 hypothetical protein [Kineosporia succinea]